MEMGSKFWFGLIGLAIAVVIVGVVLFMFFGWAWYTFGFIATFALLAGVLILIAWIFDRREAQRRGRLTG